MKARTALILVLVCAALGGAWYFITQREKAPQAARPVIGARLFPDLPVNDITRIVLTDARGSLTIEKRGGGWVVAEYYGYPARFDGVADALRKLYEMKIGQTQRVKPASLATLQLADPAEAKGGAGAATLVECYAAGAEPVARLFVGKAHESATQARQPRFGFGGPMPDGQYVRMAGSDLVIIAGEPFPVDADRETWVEKQLFNVPNADLRDITVTDPAGVSYRLYRPTNGADLVIDGAYPTQQLKMAEANSVASGLSYFRVDKVLSPADAASNTALNTPYTYVAKLYNGQVFTLTVSPTNLPESFVRVAVAYDKSLAAPVDTNATAGAVQKTPYEIEQEAKELNDKFAQWTFLLDNYKAGELRKPLQELLEPKPAETNTAPQDAKREETPTPAAPPAPQE